MSCPLFIFPQPGDVILCGSHSAVVVEPAETRNPNDPPWILAKDETGVVMRYSPVLVRFADPAVYAKRLQEAAWLADTSPFPWWIKQALLFCEDEGVDKTIEQLLRSAIELNCESMEQAAKFMLENGHHLLRWQAQNVQQQKGGPDAR